LAVPEEAAQTIRLSCFQRRDTGPLLAIVEARLLATEQVRGVSFMDTSVVFDSSAASCCRMNPSLGSPTREAATARITDVPRALFAASVVALMVALSGHAGHARDRLSGEVQRVKMIGFTVADVDREANFFAKVLQFEKVSDFRVVGSEYDKMEGVFNVNMRIVHLKLGEQIVELTQYVSPPTGRPIPVPSYSNDAWFEHMAIVVGDMDAAYKILQENNVQQISANAITIPESNPGAAGIKAIKFHDPESHDLELIYFPPGKGDPSWQKPANKLFLGLDHTAMTVNSTEKGATFYRDVLGLDVGGVTLNTGTTQDVLDDLFNDTCLVTEMMPVSAPPHIEFLDYKTPPGGRPMPVDTKANDLWHWQTTLVTKDIQAVADRLRKAGAQFITSDVVAIPQEAQAQLGFKKAVMVRDPNGHAIRLIEE
jgi:catechol 2,3-dioxygenase-like lactoylglutathione lyase family enzyme